MAANKITIKNLDHLGLVAGMIDELGIENEINKLIPTNEKKKQLSYGMLCKAMILNGLGYVNKQLYLTPRFFENKPLKRLFGADIEASMINDDALGRTLDALYAYGVNKGYSIIAAKAMEKLSLIPQTLHLDSTSFHVDGKYNSTEAKDDSVVHITQGYSRDHHPQLNQVVLNLIVENQSGIPIWMKPSDGNQTDTKAFAAIIKEHIESLKKGCADDMQLIGDAALYTSKSLEVFKEHDISFISRVPMTITEAKDLQSKIYAMEFKPIDENYQASQHGIIYAQIPQQWVLYRSAHAKHKEDKTLQKTMMKNSFAEIKSLNKLTKSLFYCEADAAEALQKYVSKLKWIELQNSKIVAKPIFKAKGRPKKDALPDTIQYRIDAIASMPIGTMKTASESESGLFILATNNLELSAKELLIRYKSQQRVERGFRFLKSPEFLSDSLFLKNPERIEALLMIMTLSLMVYAALEYSIRKELKNSDKTFPNQLGKPINNPTARWVFESFFAIHLLSIPDTTEQVIGLLTRHSILLDLLGKRYWKFYE